MKPFLSVILLVRDEGETILDPLLSLDYMLSLSEFSYECVCVCSAHAPHARRVCEKFSKITKYMRVCEANGTRDWRELFWEGVRASRGNIRMFLDPGAVPLLRERERILEKLKEGYECVIAVDGIKKEGEYTMPHSIPRMITFQEELVSMLERIYYTKHGRRVFFAEIIEFFIQHKKRVYAFSFSKKEIPKVKETLVETIIHRIRLYKIKKRHARIQKI